MKMLSCFPIWTLTLLIASVIAATEASGHGPRFKTPGSEIREVVGKDIHVPCEVENTGNLLIIWRKRTSSGWQQLGFVSPQIGPQMMFNGDGRYSIGHSRNLIIQKVSSEDNGEYKCTINSKPPLEQISTLEVLVKPTITMSPNTSSLTVMKGDVVNLFCDGEGNPPPTVTWDRRHAKSFPKEVYVEWANGMQPPNDKVVTTEELVFNQISYEASGKYTCLAVNELGKASANIDIQVESKPEISVPQEWIHSAEGLKAELICIFEGVPSVNVTWHKGIGAEKHRIPNAHRIKSSSSEEGHKQRHILTIDPVASSDFDFYSCSAVNKHGRADGIVALSGKPYGVELTHETKVHGTSIHLKWRSKSMSPINGYAIRYRKATKGNSSNNKSKEWVVISVPPHKPHGKPVHKGSYELTGLHEDTVYELAARAKNQYGWSDYGETQRFRTSEGNSLEFLLRDTPNNDEAGTEDPPSSGNRNGVTCITIYSIVACLVFFRIAA